MTGLSIFSKAPGIVTAILIVFGVELYLHNDDFLDRYRSVFAVGRAADKVAYVARTQPSIVLLGNSRVDNGISPVAVSAVIGKETTGVFNLGIPGQNTRVLSGVVRELESRGALTATRMKYVLIGLDPTLFSLDDELNYSVFLADRWEMASAGEYSELAASIFRLWGYSSNLKGLREPGRMRDFIAATLTDREPWGGSLRDNLGYRAKKEEMTEPERKTVPEDTLPKPLDPKALAYLSNAVRRLLSHDMRVGVFFPPQYGRKNDFEKRDAAYEQYRIVLADLRRRGVEILHIENSDTYAASLFSDPGHLNEAGAKRYSTSLARAMKETWPNLGLAE